MIVLAIGGTIAMTGAGGASPELDADELLTTIPEYVRPPDLRAETLMNRPSAHLTLNEQLETARRARDLARQGTGVVVTHGTDTLEETAMLCDLLHDAEAPVVFTGAIRPASAPGADGPANLADAISVAASPAADGFGTLVCFGGEIHHARTVRKSDVTSTLAFSSPQTGPIGRVTEGRVAIRSTVARSISLDPTGLDARVPVVPAVSGDDGTLAHAVLDTDPDGVVVGTLGAGHLPPPLLELWADAAERIPVVACSRPERGSILTGTYGFPASERDLRQTGLIPAGFLSQQAARIKLIACLSARLDLEEVRGAFRQDDS